MDMQEIIELLKRNGQEEEAQRLQEEWRSRKPPETPPEVRARVESQGLDFSDIPPSLWKQALEAFEKGDAARVLSSADNLLGMRIVQANVEPLKARGIYEEALLEAFTGTRTNWHHWPMAELERLIRQANRDRLLAAGDPLPGPGPFTLYRGVAGRGAARRIRGLFWTDRLDKARWFADWHAEQRGLADPTVFRLVVPLPWIFAYSNARQESDFIVLLPREARPKRCP